MLNLFVWIVMGNSFCYVGGKFSVLVSDYFQVRDERCGCASVEPILIHRSDPTVLTSVP